MARASMGQVIIRTISQTLFTIVLYLIAIALLGLALYPAVIFIVIVWIKTSALDLSTRLFVLSITLPAAYFIWGFSLMIVTWFAHVLLRLRLKPGVYPIGSAGAYKWFISNSLMTLVSIVFMRFILLTPFASLFYRFMGAKLGGNVQINSEFCADLSLMEIGQGAVIGGHATVIGHLFKRNSLVLKPVKIGPHAVIGLNAVVMPGAVIGEKAIVAAGAMVPMDTVVPPRSVYTGPDEKSKSHRIHTSVEPDDSE